MECSTLLFRHDQTDAKSRKFFSIVWDCGLDEVSICSTLHFYGLGNFKGFNNFFTCCPGMKVFGSRRFSLRVCVKLGQQQLKLAREGAHADFLMVPLATRVYHLQEREKKEKQSTRAHYDKNLHQLLLYLREVYIHSVQRLDHSTMLNCTR